MVRGVNAPNADATHRCSVDDFVVTQASSNGAVAVRAGGTSSLSDLHVPRATWPRIGILARSTNQDACKGASLTLAYTASRTLRIL